MKRSSTVSLVLMGSIALAGCGDKRVDTAVYESMEDCIAAGNESLDCDGDYAAARASHSQTAPAFRSQDDCEADFGEGNCEETDERHAGGSGLFMPLMMGYMLGGIARGSGPGLVPQPLYRQGGTGTFYNGAGAVVARAPGATTISARSPAARSPQAATSTLSRGGFGTRAQSVAS